MRSVLLSLLLFGVIGIGCSKTGDPAAAASARSPVAANPAQDRIQVMQALLDSPWIQNALEPEGKNPSPLVLVSPTGLEGSELSAFGQKVKLLSPEQAQAQRPESYLEVSAVHLEGDNARVSFRSDADGVSGEAELRRNQGRWQVARVTGSEN